MKKQQKQILVIEDHESLRLLLGSMLNKDYNVVTKRDGLDGMAWLSKGNCPDLIILDMQMPHLNGIQFLQNLRHSGFFRYIPVVILSGNDDEEEINLTFKLGVKAYLKKPFNPSILKETIQRILVESRPSVL